MRFLIIAERGISGKSGLSFNNDGGEKGKEREGTITINGCPSARWRLPSGDDRTILIVGLFNRIGALQGMVGKFGIHGVNLVCINSLTSRVRNDSAHFYVEVSVILPFHSHRTDRSI